MERQLLHRAVVHWQATQNHRPNTEYWKEIIKQDEPVELIMTISRQTEMHCSIESDNNPPYRQTLSKHWHWALLLWVDVYYRWNRQACGWMVVNLTLQTISMPLVFSPRLCTLIVSNLLMAPRFTSNMKGTSCRDGWNKMFNIIIWAYNTISR